MAFCIALYYSLYYPLTDHIIPKPQISQSTNECKWYRSNNVCVYGRTYGAAATFYGEKAACCAPGLSYKEHSTCTSGNAEVNGHCPTPPVSVIFEDLFMLTF
jgi:hypothetical protein